MFTRRLRQFKVWIAIGPGIVYLAPGYVTTLYRISSGFLRKTE